MIVLSLTDCPPRLRGDLSRWLCELSTGVYVGQLSARVRDALWQRVCENLKNGRATMVFTTNNEQRMDFRVHNTVWEPIDFDGMKLMLRPDVKRAEKRTAAKPSQGKASKYRMARAHSVARNAVKSSFVVIDVETTGLSSLNDEIIELAALRVSNWEATDSFSALVRQQKPLPESIAKLTGITDELLQSEGKPLAEALTAFIEFVGGDQVVAHNAPFDYAFLRGACQRCGIPLFSNPCVDTLILARRRYADATSFKLSALAERLGLDASGAHRSLRDCQLNMELYREMEKGTDGE